MNANFCLKDFLTCSHTGNFKNTRYDVIVAIMFSKIKTKYLDAKILCITKIITIKKAIQETATKGNIFDSIGTLCLLILSRIDGSKS